MFAVRGGDAPGSEGDRAFVRPGFEPRRRRRGRRSHVRRRRGGRKRRAGAQPGRRKARGGNAQGVSRLGRVAVLAARVSCANRGRDRDGPRRRAHRGRRRRGTGDSRVFVRLGAHRGAAPRRARFRRRVFGHGRRRSNEVADANLAERVSVPKPSRPHRARGRAQGAVGCGVDGWLGRRSRAPDLERITRGAREGPRVRRRKLALWRIIARRAQGSDIVRGFRRGEAARDPRDRRGDSAQGVAGPGRARAFQGRAGRDDAGCRARV